MIVVAVIGILAAIAMPRFSNLLLKAKEADVKKNLASLRSAVNIYYADCEYYPGDIEVALTSNRRYLEKMMTATIPPVTDQGNIGHAADSRVVLNTVDDFASGAWLYVLSGNDADIHLNCTHLDSKASVWSVY